MVAENEKAEAAKAIEQAQFRFGYMFGESSIKFAENDLYELAGTMFGKENAERGNPKIPAGYTFLGQFIDHDLAFDHCSMIDTNIPLDRRVGDTYDLSREMTTHIGKLWRSHA